MIRVERKVTLHRKHNQSVYETRNATAFITPSVNLTSSVNAVNAMLACASELAVSMPTIVGMSPNNENWQSTIASYFHSITIPVSKLGTDFNTSFVFNIDLDRPDFKRRLNEYISSKGIELEAMEGKTADTVDRTALEKEVCSYIIGDKGASFAIDEKDMYQFVIFENVEDYIKYRYCLVSSRVANDVTLLDKSPNIAFYLATEASTVKEQEVKYKQSQDALATYMKIVSGDASAIDDYLISFNLIGSHHELETLSIAQKGLLLQKLAIADAIEFMRLYTTPNHKLRATIEKMIWFNVLTRMPSTGTIVDAGDTSKIVGNSMDEAIAFASNKINAGTISIWESKLNSLVK